MRTYQRLAVLVQAYLNCRANDNDTWMVKHGDSILALMQYAPHGSGFDSDTTIDFDFCCTPDGMRFREVLRFDTAFHHMDENGYYDGWTYHSITVRPSLLFGFTINITGIDKNGIKDYIREMFDGWLNMEVKE